MQTATYTPQIFDQPDLASARSIVLTPESGVSSMSRWETETPWLLSLLQQYISPNSLIADYGCGVGRMSLPLVQSNHSVIGIDSSESMRMHAEAGITSDRFLVTSPEAFTNITNVVSQVDAVLSIWVLQHCYDPESEIFRIYNATKINGLFMVVDMNNRAVPTDVGWVNDGKDISELVGKRFRLIRKYHYSPPNAPESLRNSAYVAFYKKVR